ncbi:hypothetical protein Xmau_03859 [Xenorhabdus mauleonii]|uniref:Uncharacterized protein n=1 Tax=Xenorhabdus mauleonii TaxID=351675 RepID=A0A1I3V5Q6_9GAMM|nr:hypothetical protein [Xenorhabdus mauleonii]PHM37641.1 hypothetical protein Xmau_03859 [Xenorhabdus mauleonii]SFJ90615.1 hypothetical protein SAMN05421680_11963 [Xenorhabdus mauleonii]
MSDNNLNYRRGYIELVKLCTLMLNTIATDVKNGDTTIRIQSSEQLLSAENVDLIIEESRILLHSISPSESFDLAEHDALFSRLMDLFSTLYGNEHSAWLSYQPEFEKRRKMQMN